MGMNLYEYRGKMYSVNELSEMSGIAPTTIRDRIRRGYSVEEAVKLTALNDSVKAFCDASYYKDWIGMPSSYLYEIYWKWCVSGGYTPLSKQGFSRQVFSMYSLYTVPSGKQRIIRER